MKGKFIVLEGGEGSGKDTHIARLKEKYAGREDIVFTREPGGTQIGERIRALLLSKESVGMQVRTELLLFLAARAQLMEEIIVPALTEGKTVISNRFGLSTIAYQIYGRERKEYLSFLSQLSDFVVGEHRPDAYILLDVTPEVGLARVQARADENTRFDDEALAFHARVRNGYTSHVGDFGTPFVVNADRDLESVWRDVEKAVASVYGI